MAANSEGHSHIVLFYRYFLPSEFPLFSLHAAHYVELLRPFLTNLCGELGLKGRLLVAEEGINGTLSGSSGAALQEFTQAMKSFQLVRDLGAPPGGVQGDADSRHELFLFRDVDWKLSTSATILEPFPDLKVRIVKEIISSGGTVPVEDLEKYKAPHLEPADFHRALTEHPDAVLVDVRNTFEYEIGHFVQPETQQAALNPEMVTFSSFDANFCAKQTDQLRGKKLLLYCTGGIRCEKASVMLKKRGCSDVSQLSGGIHRYLEQFGSDGCFRGLNFVFDQRVAQTPMECCSHGESNEQPLTTSEDIVGRCVECAQPFQELCGSRVCAVCRDLVLICSSCQPRFREYHCRRHSAWKTCYFFFLEIFSREHLLKQKMELHQLRETHYVPASQHKNVRRTISRQIEKINQRLADLDAGEKVDEAAPARCRTCHEPNTVCDGRCWGFWKTAHPPIRELTTDVDEIVVGDTVEPGPHWNVVRLGSRTDEKGRVRLGTVVEIKSWSAGGSASDCVAVCWNGQQNRQPDIYRWGVPALNGKHMYDVIKVS